MTPDLDIRPFQLHDADVVAQLHTASVLGQWTYRPEHFRESTDPARRRLVALRDKDVVATASLAPFGDSAPHALRLDLAGDPQAFTPLYLALLAVCPVGYPQLLGVTREDFTGLTFFQRAGFRNAWQSWGAHLDLSTWDFERFRRLEKRLFIQGYEVEQWQNEAPEASWQALHALHQLGEQDVPRNPTTSSTPLDLQAFREVVRREEVVFVVRRGEALVALTQLTLPRSKGLQEAGAVSNDLTTTHAAHRARGLATLVKAHALRWAQREGYVRAGTGGTVLNLPMLRVNTRLGYRTEPMWVTWERRLD